VTNPNYGLLGGNNALSMFQYGAQLGTQRRQEGEQREDRNALIALRERQEERQVRQDERAAAKDQREVDQEALLTQLRTRAIGGDRTALQELATRDPAAFKEYETQGRTALAEAAFDIIQTPDQAQRAAKWDSYAQRFNRPDLVGQYTDQRLNEVVAQGGLQQEFQRFQQPDYLPVGEGGLAGFQFGQPIQQGGQPQSFAPPPPAGFVIDNDGGPGGSPSGAGFQP
jgi:ribosomal protein L20